MKKYLIILLAMLSLSPFFGREKALKEHITETRIAKQEPIDLGSGTLKLKKILSNSLATVDFSVQYNPRKDTGELLYRNSTVKERISFDEDARKSLCKAFENYLSDYDGKKLKKGSKFNKAYGHARLKAEWGTLTINMYAEPKAYYGYIFVGKSPYFAIRILPQKMPEKKNDVQPEYAGNILYFNRSQAKELVEALSEDSISKVKASIFEKNNIDDGDEYAEDDAPVEEKEAEGEYYEE